MRSQKLNQGLSIVGLVSVLLLAAGPKLLSASRDPLGRILARSSSAEAGGNQTGQASARSAGPVGRTSAAGAAAPTTAISTVVRDGATVQLSTAPLTSLDAPKERGSAVGASLRPFAQSQPLVAYDIVYIRSPRPGGDNAWPTMPDIQRPLAMEPGSDLMLLHPNGAEEVLYSAGADGAAMDPTVSFDGQWVYFSFMPDARNLDPRSGLSPAGADIYKINVQTRQVIRLTRQVWTPPSGAANWSTDHLSANPPGTNYIDGIFNLSPCPLPGGRVMFVSNRDGYLPNKGATTPNLRLYIMDDDGGNLEKVGHLNVGSALHPTVLMDGRVMFSSMESQGLRSAIAWCLWAIWPDGRKWEPLMSAFAAASAMHFQTQRTDGKIVVTEYYVQTTPGLERCWPLILSRRPERRPSGAPTRAIPRIHWCGAAFGFSNRVTRSIYSRGTRRTSSRLQASSLSPAFPMGRTASLRQRATGALPERSRIPPQREIMGCSSSGVPVRSTLRMACRGLPRTPASTSSWMVLPSTTTGSWC